MKDAKSEWFHVALWKHGTCLNFFSLSNKYTDLGSYRKYDIREIKLSRSQCCTELKPSTHELLRSIAIMWPQSNESNVGIFMSLLIHFSVEQINSEMGLNACSEEFSSSDRVNIPLPSPKVAPVTPPRKIESTLESSFPVTLKTYTEALVCWETKDEVDRKFLFRGFIFYGISYAQKTPESLETFFDIAETKAAGALSENSWAQLLCYLYGLVPVMCIGVLLIIEKESSKRQGRKRENQIVISTAFWQTGMNTSLQ